MSSFSSWASQWAQSLYDSETETPPPPQVSTSAPSGGTNAPAFQMPDWLQNFVTQSEKPQNIPTPFAPYSSRGSQTRMDELPPSARQPEAQGGVFNNPFYQILPKPEKPLFDVPQFLRDVTPDEVERALKPLGDVLTAPVPKPNELPVIGPVVQGVTDKVGETMQGYQEHVVEPTVGNVSSNNLMLKANPIPATIKAIQTGKAEDWNTALGLPIVRPGESPAQRIAGKVNQGDIAGAAQELWKSFEQPGREAYSELDPASQLVGSLLFDPMNFIPGLGIGASQKFRKVAQATTDVTKVGEAVADAPFLARLWDNLNPLARAAEGELLDVGKLGLKQAAAPDSVGGLANAARKMAEGVNPLTAFQKTPMARAIDWTQRVHDYLLPLASDARTTFADMVRLNERSQEALRAGKFTDDLKQVVSDVKTVNSADFQRAVHGTLNFKQPEAVMASYRRGQEMLEGINQWTQAARPNLSKLRETLLDTRPFSEAYGDASKFSDLTANQRGAFQRFAKTLDAYETGAGGAGATELRAATRQLQSDLEQIAKLEYADAWVTHTGSVVKGLANLPDEVQLADKIINKIRAYESVLLLGANPHYVAQNIVSDWVRLGMHGVNPMESAEDIGRTFNRAFGTSDLKKIMGNAAEQLSKADARYLPNAPYGASVPARVSNLPIIKQLGDLNKTMNARSQLRSFATGFRRTFKTNWKYGTTIPQMPEQLAQAIRAQGGEKALKSVIKRLENSFNTGEMRDALTTPFPMWETYADAITPALNDILKKNGIDFQATPEMLDHLINHSTGDFVNETLQRVIQRVNKEGAENYARIWDEEAAGVQRRHVDWKKQADAFEAENFGKPASSVEPPIEQAAPNVPPEPIAAAPIEPAPRVEPLPEANVADETMQTAPVPENAPAVTPLDENPLAPANLPEVQLTEGQQSARDYLLSLKNAEGAPQYTAEQLATWKPETLERFAGELSSFDDILRTFTAKTGKDATKSGDYLKNLLNAEISRKGFKDPQIEKIAPFRDMQDIQARADEAYRLLRGYDTYPTLQEGEFKWQLRVKMLEDEMPQKEQDAVEAVYDALANTAAKRAGMDVDTWWTKRAAGIEGGPATGNVRGLQQEYGRTALPDGYRFVPDGVNGVAVMQGNRKVSSGWDAATALRSAYDDTEFAATVMARNAGLPDTTMLLPYAALPKRTKAINPEMTSGWAVTDMWGRIISYAPTQEQVIENVISQFGKVERQPLIVEQVRAPFERGLFQRLNAENTKGATDFLRDGRALLRFFKGKADASTYVHEAAHLFMPTLDASDMDELAKWTGLNNGDELRLLHERWVRGDATLGKLPGGKRAELQFREMGKATSDAERYAIAQEKFARGFEKYLAEGVAPTEGLQRVFDQFKDFLLEIYRGVTGSEIDVKLTDEMRALYGRMLDADQAISPQDLKRIQDEAIRAARGEMAEQGLGVGAHLKAGFFDGFFQHGVPESKKIWQYTKATEGMPHWWYPISNGNNIGTTMRGKKMPPFVSALGPKKEMLFGTARKDWKLVNGADNPEWADFVLETYNQTLFPDGSRQLETIDDLLKLVDENLAHNAPSRSLAQKGKTRVPKGQMDMFASQGRVDDMPLFSGTPQTAKESAFVPEEELGKQGKLFDTRPEFGGTKPNVAPIAEMPQSPKDAPTGAQVFAARINSAEERFIDYAMERGGLTREEALAALRKYHEVKAIKIDPVMGQFQFTHGAFAEPDVIRRAAGVEETAARMPQAETGVGLSISDSSTSISQPKSDNPLISEFQAKLGIYSTYGDGTPRIDQAAMDFAGDRNLSKRQAMIEAMTGERPLRSKSSVSNLESAYTEWLSKQSSANALPEQAAQAEIPNAPLETAPVVEPPAPSPKPTEGEYAGEGFRWRSDETPPPNLQASGQFTLFQDIAERLKDPTAPTDPNLKADVETAMANEVLRILKPYLEADIQNYGRALDPITNELIEQYLYQIEPNLTDMKRAASQVGRWYHQHTTMDYSQRWNVDDAMNYIAPFTFFPLHMAANFAQDFLDKPALFAMYAKLQNEVDQQSKDLPSRFSHRIKIPMPFLPDWMGDGMFVDPFATAFPVRQVFNLDDLERATWQSQNGEPMDNAGLIADMYGTHLPYKLGYQLLMGDKASLQDTLANLPPVRMAKAFGLNPETEIAGMQPFKGKWDNFYLQRAAGDMVANGELDEKRMRIALLTRKGEDWDRIVERSRLQNYTAPQLSGWTGFTGKVYPAGELRYNEARLERDRLKESLLEQFGASPNLDDTQQYEFLKAKGAYAAGGQLRQFLDAHPELERGGAFQETDEMYRDYLIDGLWDKWRNASALEKKLWKAELGEQFNTSFQNKATRDYATIPTQQLLGWANALKVGLPDVTADLQQTPDPYRATLPNAAQNARYQSFYDEVENAYGWQQYGAAWDKYYELKKNDPQAAKAFWKTPDGMKLNAVRARVEEFYKENPDIQTLLERAGAIAIRRAEEKTPSAPGSVDAQKQAWGASLGAVGYASYEEYKQESDGYYALPKGSDARRKYLAEHPRLERQWKAGRAIYGEESTNTRGSGSKAATWRYYPERTYRKAGSYGTRTPRLWIDYRSIARVSRMFPPAGAKGKRNYTTRISAG